MAAGRWPKPVFLGAPSPWADARSPSPGPRGWRAASNTMPPMRSAKPSHRPRSNAASPSSGQEPHPPRALRSRVKLSPFPARPMPPICGNGRSLHPRPASDSPPKPRPPHAANPGPRQAPRGSGLKCRMEPRFVHPPVRPSLTRVQIATVRPNRGPWLPPAAAARRQPPPAGGAANGAGRQPQIGEPVTLLVPRQLDLTLQSRTAVILRTPGQPGLGNPAAQESANT